MKPPSKGRASSGKGRRHPDEVLGLTTSSLALFLGSCLVFSLLVAFFHGSFLLNDSKSGFSRSLIHPIRHQQQNVKISSSSSFGQGLDVAMFAGSMFNVSIGNKKLGALSCDAFPGGPYDAGARQEMIYWQDITQDENYISPFYDKSDPKFLTFEPDPGGFNNIRMAMEVVLTMAVAMGRILVLPPDQKMYLLNKHGNDEGQESAQHQRAFGFQDFFPMQEMAHHIRGLKIISMEEFLETQGLKGKLRHVETGQVLYPPNNVVDYNSDNNGIETVLNPYLRSIGFGPSDWSSEQCMVAIPAQPGNDEMMTSLFSKMMAQPGTREGTEYVGMPTSVRGSTEERWRENNAARPNLCLYNKEMQSKHVLHFAGKKDLAAGRLLVHSYAFLFFQDWKTDLWMKRFVRDHVRYNNEIQCAAARIVQAIRQYVVQKEQLKGNKVALPPTSANAPFDAFHVRRGDFQYKSTRVEASVMFDVCKDEIPEGAVVYMATDERQKSFFDPLAEHYDMLFLDNFTHLIEGMNPNFLGMIDQLVASRSRTFFGCWFSTFSAYINRLRGYDSDLHKLPGFAHGILNSYHYAPRDKRDRMQEFWPVSGAFYAREFPTAWRNIDHGIDELYKEQLRQEEKVDGK